MNRDWHAQSERGTSFMVHLIRAIAMHLGRPAARLVLYPITLYFLLFAPAARRASRDFLQRVLPGRVHVWHVGRHIHSFAATILDRVFLLTGKHDRLDIRFHGLDVLQQQVEAGSGCILLGSHLGSFEVLRALAVCKYRHKVKIVMEEAHNETLTRILHTLNPDIKDTVILPGSTDVLLQVHEHLQQGFIVGMLGDRVIDSTRAVSCTVLDQQTALPSGPLLAAAALQVPVILFFGMYRGGNRYDIILEMFADELPRDRSTRARDIQGWVQAYADRLTHYARRYPYNWFNFYDFWESHD